MDNVENSVATLSDRLDTSVNCTPGSYYTSFVEQSQAGIFPDTPAGRVAPTVPTPSPLQDVTNINVFGRNSAGGLSDEMVFGCRQSCKSQRNLAARLSAQVFSDAQRRVSNCQEVAGKKALDPVKLKAIFNVCIQKYPFEALDPVKLKAIFNTCIQKYPFERAEAMNGAEKKMRNAIDKHCRKLKRLLDAEKTL